MPSATGVRCCYAGAALPCFLHGVLPTLSFQALATRFDIIEVLNIIAADSQA